MTWLDFDPQAGHEQAGRRPALVISPGAYNARVGLALLCPITSQEKGYPFEVPIETERVRGVVLADQVRGLDWKSRRAELAVQATERVVEDVLQKLAALIR